MADPVFGDWLNDPVLAYAKGMHDGYELGRAEGVDELQRILVESLRELLDPAAPDIRSAIRSHHRKLDTATARRAEDRRNRATTKTTAP